MTRISNLDQISRFVKMTKMLLILTRKRLQPVNVVLDGCCWQSKIVITSCQARKQCKCSAYNHGNNNNEIRKSSLSFFLMLQFDKHLYPF